jgi:MFS family permease
MRPKTSNYAWAIVIGCIALYAVPVGVIGNNAGLFIHPVMTQFGWSQTETTLYMSIQPWVAAICTPFAGWVIKKYNPRWILTAASGVFCLASLACAFFTAAWQWDIYGVVYGITAAFYMYIATPTLINRWFKKNQGFLIGLCGALLSVFAAILSPIIQAWITAYGWQTARIIDGIIGSVLSIVLTGWLLRSSPEEFGLKPWGWTEELAAKEAAQSESKTELPGATLKQAAKNPALYMIMLVAGMLVISASFVQQLSNFAQTGVLGAAVGALAVTMAMIGGIVGKFLLGWFSDHFGASPAGVLCGALGFVGALVAFIAGANAIVFYVGVFVYGIGYSALSTIPPQLTSHAFGQRSFTQIYAWVTTALNVISGFSATIYALIHDLSGSYNGAFIMMMVFYALTLVLSIFIVPLGKRAWDKRH